MIMVGIPTALICMIVAGVIWGTIHWKQSVY